MSDHENKWLKARVGALENIRTDLEKRIAELEAGQQAAIDAALQAAIDAMPVGSIHACDIIRSRIGINPLEELKNES